MHRAQGQTLGDCTVLIDLGLDNPDVQPPKDAAAVLYVAITRVRRLQDLLVSHIFPSSWSKIRDSADADRRKEEDTLRDASLELARKYGKLKAMRDELAWKPAYGDVDAEWQQLREQGVEPISCRQAFVDRPPVEDKDLLVVDHRTSAMVPVCLHPAVSERHIGIDQGRKNFAIAVVDKFPDRPPHLIDAILLHPGLPDNFTAADALMKLQDSALPIYMQQTNSTTWHPPLQHVDRVVVHIEQMSTRNRHWKEFGPELGQLLQRTASDPTTCVVQLSQPHVHRATGPLFKLGQRIVDELHLVPATYGKKRGRPSKPTLTTTKTASSSTSTSGLPGDSHNSATTAKFRRVDADVEPDDVEPSDGEPDDVQQDDVEQTDGEQDVMPPDLLDDSVEYRKKKQMSARFFRYLMEADNASQDEMGLTVEPVLQARWRSTDRRTKMDDVGDAVLHALNDLLCGGSNYRQLLPANSALQSNRTVVVAVQPDATYWAVLHVTWNRYELIDFGTYCSCLENAIFLLPSTVANIKSSLPDNLRAALTVFDSTADAAGEELYPAVDFIKIVVKQIKGYHTAGFTNEQAGALTHSTVVAMKQLCAESVGVGTPSQLVDRHDKILGTQFILTNLATGRKFQVVRSAGKQTNAMLAFPQWTRENATKFVDKRLISMNRETKVALFNDLRGIASQPDSQFEMMNLSANGRKKLVDDDWLSDDAKMMLADVLLIGVNKNEKHVKAVADNYRQAATKKATSTSSVNNTVPGTIESTDEPRDVEPME